MTDEPSSRPRFTVEKLGDQSPFVNLRAKVMAAQKSAWARQTPTPVESLDALFKDRQANMASLPESRTATAAESMKQHLEFLAETALRQAELAAAAAKREATMLAWTRWGVILAGVAAVASVVAIVVAISLA